MLWYDAFSPKNSTNHFFHSKYALRTRLYKTSIQNPSLKKNTLNYTKLLLLPPNWNFLTLYNNSFNHHTLVFISDVYFFKLPTKLNLTSFFFEECTKQIIFKIQNINNDSISMIYFLYSILNLFTTPNFKKLKFKGIYKNYRNTITPQFGYSHRLYLYSFFTNVIFLNKSELIIFGFNQKYLNTVSDQIVSWRPVNIFTGRGVRFNRQIFYKKAGKVSSYR
jgi:hypothetical protein